MDLASLPGCVHAAGYPGLYVEFKEDVAKEAMGATKGTTPKRNIGVLPRWTPPEHAKWSLVARILPLHGQWRVICAALPAAKPNRAASSLFYAHSFRTVKKRKMSHNSGGLIYISPLADASHPFLTGRLLSDSVSPSTRRAREATLEVRSRKLRGSRLQQSTSPDVHGGVEVSVHELTAFHGADCSVQQKESSN